MRSDYNFHRVGSTSAPHSAQKPATDLPDLSPNMKLKKPTKTRAKKPRKPTIYEQSFGEKLKALVTGKAPKKLTKKRGKR